MTIWVDGELLGGATVPRSSSVAPFETMGARGAEVPLWPRHVARLAATAARLGLTFTQTPELRGAASDVLLKNGHADDVLRLSLVPSGGRAQVVLSSRRRSPVRVVKLLPTILERPRGGPPGPPHGPPPRRCLRRPPP
ncbi:MAG: aminotransferase class IV, partial [Planctomycetota bacterium]|nr:aminotransferase class IV [Planctomycetota bacterium]